MILIKLIDKLLNFIVIVLFLAVTAFSGYALYDINVVYDEAKLDEDILKYKPKNYYEEEEVDEFDISSLQQEINEDICGWIRIDGTNIDYPVMAPNSALEYLDRDYKKQYSPGGSIFIDYKSDRFFEDDYTIFYGHNMSAKLMFSDIKEFENTDFFNDHKTGKLYTENANYTIDIISFGVLDSASNDAYVIDNYKTGKNNELIENFQNNAINSRDISVSSDDKIILLSTCNGSGTTNRATLFCKLTQTSSTQSINSEVKSDIAKDEKREQKAKIDEKRNIESNQKLSELQSIDKKNEIKASTERGVFASVSEIFNNSSVIYFYILVIFTSALYVVILVKKVKIKETIDTRFYDPNSKANTIIENRNTNRIVKLLNKNTIKLKKYYRKYFQYISERNK